MFDLGYLRHFSFYAVVICNDLMSKSGRSGFAIVLVGINISKLVRIKW